MHPVRRPALIHPAFEDTAVSSGRTLTSPPAAPPCSPRSHVRIRGTWHNESTRLPSSLRVFA